MELQLSLFSLNRTNNVEGTVTEEGNHATTEIFLEGQIKNGTCNECPNTILVLNPQSITLNFYLQ